MTLWWCYIYLLSFKFNNKQLTCLIDKDLIKFKVQLACQANVSFLHLDLAQCFTRKASWSNLWQSILLENKVLMISSPVVIYFILSCSRASPSIILVQPSSVNTWRLGTFILWQEKFLLRSATQGTFISPVWQTSVEYSILQEKLNRWPHNVEQEDETLFS
jgi:hypothetical protein